MGAARAQMALGDSFAATEAVKTAGLVGLGLLGLARSRITVPVTNLVLDPGGTTSPYRPHPGRLNLASGLVALVIAAGIAGASETVTGWLMIAVGAAFLDRLAEGGIGRAALLIASVALRLAPAILWVAGSAVWLSHYLPLLANPETLGDHDGG